MAYLAPLLLGIVLGAFGLLVERIDLVERPTMQEFIQPALDSPLANTFDPLDGYFPTGPPTVGASTIFDLDELG